MLSDDFYAKAEANIQALYGGLEDEILRDIVRRIVKNNDMTDTATWQIAKLQEAGMVYDDVLTEIIKMSGKTEKEIKQLFRDGGIEALAFDDQIYQLAGIKTVGLRQSPALLKVLESGYIKTAGLLHNLTLTTALTAQTAYHNACDAAYMQVASGAFSYQTAIKNAVQSAIAQSDFVLYPSGHRDHLDVAIRRAVLTGLNQTTIQLQFARMDDLDVDLVEVSAHAGARPDHAVWQGRVYSRSGRSTRYPDFVSSTGYGTGPGLGGWNCRHNCFPFFEGLSKRAYSDKVLKGYDAEVFEYDGKTYTRYEGNQKQRAYERAIRQTKRELVGLDEGIKSAESDILRGDLKSAFDAAAVKLKKREAKLQEFLDASGMRNDRDRQRVYGFNQSVSSKAVWANKVYTKAQQTDIIKLNDIYIVKTLSARGKNYDIIDPANGEVFHFVPGTKIQDVQVFAGKGTRHPLKHEVSNGLSEQIGGSPSEWQHCKGHGIVDYYGEERPAEIHWFQEKSIGKVKFKIKRWDDEG